MRPLRLVAVIASMVKSYRTHVILPVITSPGEHSDSEEASACPCGARGPLSLPRGVSGEENSE